MTGQGEVPILVVEDHPDVRSLLVEVINRIDGLVVRDEAASGELAVDLLRHGPAPDLAVIDMSLPSMSGADLVAEIRRRVPEVLCVILSGHREGHYVEQALAAGASGYILKGDPYELEGAIRHVLDGGVYLSPGLRIS
jgi:DNA-binding NarL/FixJ family response regulator